MKKIATLFSLLIAVMLTSCGSTGYDLDEAKDLVKKIEANEEFTQDDFSKAISLMKDATTYSFDMIQKVDLSDKEEAAKKMTEIASDPENREIDRVNTAITAYIYSHRAQLDEANQDALKKVEEYAVERAGELRDRMKAAL